MRVSAMRRRSIRCLLVSVVLVAYTKPAASAELAVEKELATETGWRAAKWLMSVPEMAQAFGKDFQEQKRAANQKDAAVVVRGKLRTKLSIDGLEYEVKFGVNPTDQLTSVYLVCDKAKKESVAEVRQRLTELFGETHSQDRTYGRVGVAIHPDNQEVLSWRPDLRRIEFHSLEIRPNIFMWVRRFSVVVRKPEPDQ